MPCGIEKLLLFQLSDCSVWSCRLFWGLPENQSDFKDFVWPFKAMSKRQKQTSVLCSASSLLGIREKVVHKGHGRCVCKCVCVCRGGRELTGKYRNIADSECMWGWRDQSQKNEHPGSTSLQLLLKKPQNKLKCTEKERKVKRYLCHRKRYMC